MINNATNSYHEPTFAELYDFIVDRLQRGRVDREITKFAAHMLGSPILEMGCGTGLQLIPLAQSGFQVVGLDNAEYMLNAFKTKIEKLSPPIQENIQLIYGDMESLPLHSFENHFSFIFLTGSVFFHLNDDKERANCLRNCRALLKDEGRLLITNSHLDAALHDWRKTTTTENDMYDIYTHFYTKEDGTYQEDIRLKSKINVSKEYTFRWSFKGVSDEEMRKYMVEAGLKILPLPTDFPHRPHSDVYWCTPA